MRHLPQGHDDQREQVVLYVVCDQSETRRKSAGICWRKFFLKKRLKYLAISKKMRTFAPAKPKGEAIDLLKWCP